MCFAVSESPEEVVEVGPLVAGAVGGGGAGEVEEVFWDVGDLGSCFWEGGLLCEEG
jgi:hypothetical protein